jgi:hypothetical protein
MYSSPSFDLEFGLSQDEAAALQRIAGDIGISSLPDLVSILLRDMAAAELNPEGWQNEVVAEWLQFRLAAA